ncbi:MAG: hypothetical protein Q9M97_03710 [Candidatus Gracilibacteria bacterium]|nr:hypothetical protein [Candidatus Gracilibacteria bacterium]
MGFDRFGRIEITFIWKGDDILNKRIERKIMGYFTKTVEFKKKEIEELESKKEEEKQIKLNLEKCNKHTNKKNKNKKVELTNREVESLDGINNWK